MPSEASGRSAGILMHITSLPSAYGIGDFGPEALKFADFLHRTHQRYWQILPLNPAGKAEGYSPYGSISSMAGNTLLISPELLAKMRLLSPRMAKNYRLPCTDRVAYEEAEEAKSVLLEHGYRRFVKNGTALLKHQFLQFCKKESYWLEDFALYAVLKQAHNNLPWYQWPESFRSRHQNELRRFSNEHPDQLSKVKWLQFIFSIQWMHLKAYCDTRNIRLFGDLPFYVNYDSADVWAHPSIFKIDSKGRILGVAGVPPDYFNDNGQLWGMPVFRWNVLRKKNYAWWVQRIRKNFEHFDLVRLDHFRAFADYWEVPARSKTARPGKWKKGPGADFFNVLEKALGKRPAFVAEDLGDINERVYKLRDEFGFPGMKVLQFAFGDNMPSSDYIPHNHKVNFIVYTGTHDNNTTNGWFRQQAGKTERRNLQRYTGNVVNEKNVHQVLSRMAYASVARVAILPIQDILGLGERARMNVPASIRGNWQWRLKPGMLSLAVEHQLTDWTYLYNRSAEH